MKKNNFPVIVIAAAIPCVLASVIAVSLVRHSKDKKIPHCGGCLKNCPLTVPGCRIGQEKAEVWKTGRE